MSVTAGDLYQHAQNLPERTEEEIRTKISRLYYALFSHACDFNDQLPSEGNLLKREAGSHLQLTQKLTNPTVKDDTLQAKSRELGTKQQLAHELRVKADYHLELEVGKSDLLKCARYVTIGMGIVYAPPSQSTGTQGGGRPTLTRIQ